MDDLLNFYIILILLLFTFYTIINVYRNDTRDIYKQLFKNQ